MKPRPGWGWDEQNARPIPVWANAYTLRKISYDDPLLLEPQCGRPVPAGKNAPERSRGRTEPRKLLLNALHAVDSKDSGLTVITT